jgi:hypothetical protein
MRIATTCLTLATLVVAGCSYDTLSAPLTPQIDGLPGSAVRVEAALTDNAGKTTTVHPHFGAGVYGGGNPLVLAFPAPAAGALTFSVQAFDAADMQLAQGTTQGTYAGASLPLQVTLQAGP